MLIEIPDPEVILSVILAFVVGLGALYTFYKIRPFIKSTNRVDASLSERLEYYERQLIDIKIHLDAMELQGIGEKPEDPNLGLKQFLEKLARNGEQETKVKEDQSKILPKNSTSVPDMPHMGNTNPTDYVLHLITNKAMTSRDIQITLKRSREHTSRLMKKLFEIGYVQRNTESKPYTYSITEKGRSKVANKPSSITM